MDSIRKKAKETHKKDALKDMIPPQGPFSDLMEGSRDIDELFRDSIKKVHEKKKENETDT
jgi:hypothetical protein